MSRVKIKVVESLRKEVDVLKKQVQIAKANEKSNRAQGYKAGFMEGWEARKDLDEKKEKAIAKMREKIFSQMEKEFMKKLKLKIAKESVTKTAAKQPVRGAKRRGRSLKATPASDTSKDKMKKTQAKRRGRPPKIQQPEILEKKEQVLT